VSTPAKPVKIYTVETPARGRRRVVEAGGYQAISLRCDPSATPAHIRAAIAAFAAHFNDI
jgi:hypothetical protein